jgi:trehalose-phosphatase
LRILNTDFDEGLFFERLRVAPASVLLLDYDGTLAPFASDRLRAYPYAGVFELLTSVSRAGRTRAAIVSGRSLLDLVRFVGPGFELWASHGVEHRTRDGAIEVASVPSGLPSLLDEALGWIQRRGWASIVERKPFGFALHERGDRRMFQAAEPAVVARWSARLREKGLEIRPFDAGIEVRPAGRHKGQVVDRVLKESGPDVPVAYLGDDVGDEDAFRSLRGRGLGILVRPRERDTLADAWLSSPDGLMAFLRRWAETQFPKPAA